MPWLWVACFGISLLAWNLFHNQWWFVVEVERARVVAALRSLVFAHSLRLGSGVPKGVAHTICNTDPQRIAAMVDEVHRFWNLPLRIVLSLVILIQWLGVAATLAPVAVSVLMVREKASIACAHLCCQPRCHADSLLQSVSFLFVRFGLHIRSAYAVASVFSLCCAMPRRR